MALRSLFILLLLGSAAFSQTLPPIEPGVSQELARWRAARYSDIRYKLNLTLEKMSPVLKGTIEIRVRVAGQIVSSAPRAQAVAPPIILDWRKIKGAETSSYVSKVELNGKAMLSGSVFNPKGEDFDPDARPLGDFEAPRPQYYEWRNEHLVFRNGVVVGENVIKLDFVSPILTSGSAITRYIDKEDGSEYIYSLFVPSDASTAFPVFDQPDLKARFSLAVWRGYSAEDKDWSPVSNTPLVAKQTSETFRPPGVEPNDLAHWRATVWGFKETKPISTYVFAFAAGPFERFKDGGDEGGNPSRSEGVHRGIAPNSSTLPTGRVSASTADLSSHIYVRKSQAAKFKPHAAEVFRLNREAIKYLEQYFDYKFPFPKYDLVLIPEFPFGGMEHAGATFLRESAIIFPQEPTKGDHISRANLIFHETAHQWFGDTVTMRWFDDLWLKEGFATFMAYKALEKIMPEANAWKVFYERVKQAAYQTDSTKGTTAIYQPITNLSAAKSAYGNIVYNKAPAYLRQAEFYLGEDKFQTAVRTFLKKNEFKNAGWEDLVKEFETTSKRDLKDWANVWVKQRGLATFRVDWADDMGMRYRFDIRQTSDIAENLFSRQKINVLVHSLKDTHSTFDISFDKGELPGQNAAHTSLPIPGGPKYHRLIFPNYQDHGYGIFLLDDESRDHVLKNIQNEKDPFLRSMLWGALWDSVREGELDPRDYVELAIKNLPAEKDETIVSSILGRVSMAMNYYMSERVSSPTVKEGAREQQSDTEPSLTVGLRTRLETVLLDRMRLAATPGERAMFLRAFVANASSQKARETLKSFLLQAVYPAIGGVWSLPKAAPDTPSDGKKLVLRTKDRFDMVTRLAILGDPDAPILLAELEKLETSDDAKRYAYAARAGFATAENKAKYWNDFVNNKTISESWIEAAFGPWNSIRHSELTLPYLERALRELPNHKRGRKIFFVNGWLSAFIGGQRSEQALGIVNKFLADTPNLDKDLRLKILENVDLIERAVKIRSRYSKG